MGRYAIKVQMQSKAATGDLVTRGQHLERQFVQATLFSRPARLPKCVKSQTRAHPSNGQCDRSPMVC